MYYLFCCNDWQNKVNFKISPTKQLLPKPVVLAMIKARLVDLVNKLLLRARCVKLPDCCVVSKATTVKQTSNSTAA